MKGEQETKVYFFVNSVVSVCMLVGELGRLCPSSLEKSFVCLQRWAYRFMARNTLAIRRATRNTSIVEHVLSAWAESMCSEIRSICSQYPGIIIINMDQTSVFTQMRPTSMINDIGARSISVAMNGSSNDHVTVALTVTSRGEKLKPYIIYKGAESGPISREFASNTLDYPDDISYSVQKSAWMDQYKILDWIEK
jgi:hypothetical protein